MATLMAWTVFSKDVLFLSVNNIICEGTRVKKAIKNAKQKIYVI